MREAIGREILGNVPPVLEIAMYAAMIGAGLLAAARIVRQIRRWRAGRPEERLRPLPERARELWQTVASQRRVREHDRFTGMMHGMIFWGFLVLFLATVLTAVEERLGISFLHGSFYLVFSFTADLFGLLFVVGVALAIYRRYVRAPARLALRRRGDAAALAFLLLAGMTGFWLEGARIGLDDWPAHERLSFVGWLSGWLFSPFVPADAWSELHQWLWGIHVVAVAGLVIALPFTRLMHAFAVPLNVSLQARPLGGLRTAPVDEPPAATLRGLTWKQLLELDACTSCGRCTEVCPASIAGKPLAPASIVERLRGQLAEGALDRAVMDQVLRPDELWSCTTCAACEEICPVGVHHVDRVVDFRRVLVEGGRVQPTAARGLESISQRGNFLDGLPSERARWSERLGVRVLRPDEPCETIYWVGCAGAYDEQARRISESVVKLLQQAGEEFGILGPREGCCGDLARRLGEEGLFAELSRKAAETLRSHAPKRVLTHCPHCLNGLVEGAGLDGIEVVHHSVFFARLVREGRLRPVIAAGRRITYQDPCYLGRYRRAFDEPRSILGAIPDVQLKEMPRSQERAFCCGGGGGQVLLDVREGERIPDLRLAEAEQVGVDVVATACPFCKIMLAPAASDGPGRIVVRDVAELLAEACR